MEQGHTLSLADRLAATNVAARAHRLAYRASGGRVGTAAHGVPVLMLTTTGRSSGLPRSTMLMYLADGAGLLVLAANAGDAERPPHWYLNLRAHQDATASVRGRTHAVRAEELTPEARERQWPAMVAHNARWGRYQASAARSFPIVRLAPTA